jgi:quercetin dioxygenase-like cupin family protein
MSHQAPYAIAARESLLDTPEARVSLMTLDPGQRIPPHCHTAVTDTTLCLAGLAEMTLCAPDERRRLTPGDRTDVAPGRVHSLRNAGTIPCRLLLIQGGGSYDFVPDAAKRHRIAIICP